MTNSEDRLSRIEALAISNTEAIAANTQAITGLTQKLDRLSDKVDNLTDNVTDLTSNVNSVLARNEVLNEILLELRDSSERHQANFTEHQRTTNAALQSLEAILVQLLRIFPQQ